jgi:hypothetical protein
MEYRAVFKTFAVTYTNAATIISEDFKDTEDLDGVFSGLLAAKGGVKEWPLNGFINQYDSATWQYARTNIGDQGRTANTAQSGKLGRRLGPCREVRISLLHGPPELGLFAPSNRKNKFEIRISKSETR